MSFPLPVVDHPLPYHSLLSLYNNIAVQLLITRGSGVKLPSPNDWQVPRIVAVSPVSSFFFLFPSHFVRLDFSLSAISLAAWTWALFHEAFSPGLAGYHRLHSQSPGKEINYWSEKKQDPKCIQLEMKSVYIQGVTGLSPSNQAPWWRIRHWLKYIAKE